MRIPFSCLLLITALPAQAQNTKQWLDAFAAEPSSDARRKMLAEVPAEKSDKALKLLLQVLAEDAPVRLDWHVRAGGIEALARVPSSDAAAKKALEKVLKPAPATARLRATILAALGKSKDMGWLDLLIAGLDDPSAAVRRAAAFSLRGVRDPKGAAALLARLEASWGEKPAKPKKGAETDGFREKVAYCAALSDLLPPEVDKQRDVAAWLEWKKSAGEAPPLREGFTELDREALARKAKEDAGRTRTRTKAGGVSVGHSSTGKGKVKLLVIHDDAWDGDYFEPWLEPLHDLCEITYVKLPRIEDFDQKEVELKKSPGGLPYMPVDALADAFDKIREEKKAERFALLAHGFSTLVAARYVSRHPEKVSHLIFVGGLTGDGAYGTILDEIQKHGNNVWKDKETTNMVMNHYVEDEKTGKMIYEPKDVAEAVALQRRAFDLYWADPADPQVDEMFTLCRVPVWIDLAERRKHIVLSPEFDIAREKHPDIPVLVCAGEKSLWSNVADNQRLAKNYAKGKLVKFASSGMFPFIEEPEKFQTEVRALLGQ